MTPEQQKKALITTIEFLGKAHPYTWAIETRALHRLVEKFYGMQEKIGAFLWEDKFLFTNNMIVPDSSEIVDFLKSLRFDPFKEE